MYNPLVSIITPSYNQAKFIRYTIESVLNQEYQNIEYIIVDGGSTDSTIDILQEYKGRLKWISEKDNGQSDAINKGFRMAKGEIVAWLNSDDIYELDAIKNAVDFFAVQPDLSMIYGDGHIINENNDKIGRFQPTQAFDLWVLAYYWDYIMQPTTFYKKEALTELGFLNVDLNWCMDWDLWIRFGMQYQVGYLNKHIACSREYGDTKTSTGGFKRLREINSLMRKYGFKKFPPGAFVYFYMHARDIVSRNSLLRRTITPIIDSNYAKIAMNYLTQYSDGWIGKKMFLAIPANKKTATIEGNIVFEQLIPFTISIFHGKKCIFKYDFFQTGEFKCVFEFPPSRNNYKVDYVCLKFNKSFAPCKLFPDNNDARQLSFQLKNIVFSDK